MHRKTTVLCFGVLLAFDWSGHVRDRSGSSRAAEAAEPVATGETNAQHQATQERGLSPPFRKTWEFTTRGQIEHFVVADGEIYFGAMDSYGAVDLATGKRLWVKDVREPYFSSDIAFDGSVLFVGLGKGELISCQPKTGQVLWSLPMPSYAYPMTAHDGALLCLLREGELTALDTRTRKPRWTASLSPKEQRTKPYLGIWIKPVVESDCVIVATYANELLCLHLRDGRERWRYQFAETVKGVATDRNRVYATVRNGELVALDSDSGTRLWCIAAEDDIFDRGAPLILGDAIYFGSDDGKLYCVDTDGKLRWSRRLSRAKSPQLSAPAAHNGNLLVTTESNIVALTPDGKRLWAWDTEQPLFAYPINVLNDGMLLAGSHELHRFTMAEPTRLPTDCHERRRLAEQLVARFDELSNDDRRILGKLGDEAFAALLPLMSKRLQTYDASVRPEGRDEEYFALSALADTMRQLDIDSARHTDSLVALHRHAKSATSRRLALDMLMEKGDEETVIPMSLKNLKHNRQGPYGQTLYRVEESSHPQAVKYLREQLADANAHLRVRRAAFVNLARTGGDPGVAAVLAAKDTRRSIPTLQQFSRLERLGIKPGRTTGYSGGPIAELVETRRENNGARWGLVVSSMLGAHDDLWIARHNGTTWMEPTFTGGGRSDLGDADWLAKFADQADLRRDSDGDGWTDLVEHRLGTDHQQPDTDGDGLKDSEDKNPLAAPRLLNDAENVLAAAFEARFRFSGGRDMPCWVELPDTIEPLELAGWDWVIIPVPEKAEATVYFSLPEYDFTGGSVPRRKPGGPILWSANRTEARLQLTTIYGGLDGTSYDIHLRRFGEHWVVIRMTLTMIS